MYAHRRWQPDVLRKIYFAVKTGVWARNRRRKIQQLRRGKVSFGKKAISLSHARQAGNSCRVRALSNPFFSRICFFSRAPVAFACPVLRQPAFSVRVRGASRSAPPDRHFQFLLPRRGWPRRCVGGSGFESTRPRRRERQRRIRRHLVGKDERLFPRGFCHRPPRTSASAMVRARLRLGAASSCSSVPARPGFESGGKAQS